MASTDRRIRVLVADDSPNALRSVCRYLESLDEFEIVATARDGHHALFQAERFRPDLVLADLSMPQMNGFEAARELRKSFPEMRVVIFSGLHGLALREECLKHGADGFVEKYQMPEKLLEEIARLFPMNP